MIKIRRNVFETNSSSTHSITMCTRSEYDDWKAGKLWLCINEWPWSEEEKRIEAAGFRFGRLYPVEQINKFYEENGMTLHTYTINNIDDEFLHNIYFIPYAEYYAYCAAKTEYYDTFSDCYTTPGGESIVAFGYYGRD